MLEDLARNLNNSYAASYRSCEKLLGFVVIHNIFLTPKFAKHSSRSLNKDQ
jgi:hypothetical protein